MTETQAQSRHYLSSVLRERERERVRERRIRLIFGSILNVPLPTPTVLTAGGKALVGVWKRADRRFLQAEVGRGGLSGTFLCGRQEQR